jgi:hypothetical protein
MPGTIIDSVELQRAGEGFPLDDVIVKAHDASGLPTTLEIQVKRSITFAPSDDVFMSVVAQIVEAARKPGFWESKHEVAVATARTSRKIDGAYQDVLTWARQLGSAKVFADRIARKGSASDDMRTFVSTFKAHLKQMGFTHDDETVWKLLRRFQILIFDYTSTGSASEALARERSARALDPADAGRAGDLWDALTTQALKIAASGGDRTRETLRSDSDFATYRWAGHPNHLLALAALAENGAAALADIRDQIGDVSIGRSVRVAEVHASLELGRYVEIRGDAGVGKSGILKHFATQAQTETGIIVLKPGRTTPRGWTALRDALGYDGTARDLLVELSADGTGLLFVDNLDLFSSEEQATVNDLIRAAASVPGFSVVATARRNWGMDEVGWLARDGLDGLGRAPVVEVNELDETEVEEMAAGAPALASLLSSSHPAREVSRNLFRLARLASRSTDAPVLRTETDMANEWWDTADGPPTGRRERQRVLRELAKQAFRAAAVFDVSDLPPNAIDMLISAESLRDYGNDRVGFRHDVLREWAVAKSIEMNPASLDSLPLDKPAPAFLARSVELYARSLIERAESDLAWSALLAKLSRSGVHGTWRRSVLLALVRSEIAPRALQTAQSSLLADNGAMLKELIRTTTAVDAQAAREAFAATGLNVETLPEGFVVPAGPSWGRLVTWVWRLGDALPFGSLPDVVGLFNKWSTSMLGFDPITPKLLARLHQWLTAIEDARDERGYGRTDALFGGTLSSGQIDALERDLRYGFVMFANRVPALAADYLRAVKSRKRRDRIVQELHEFRGTLASAAPEELADLFEAELIPVARPDRDSRRSRSMSDNRVFTFFDSQFLPVSPAQGPFFDLLTAAPETGMRLIRRLMDYAIAAQTRKYEGEIEAIEIVLPDGPRRFTWPHTFLWSRENHSRFFAVTSGLMALEAWTHSRVDAGETVEAVIVDILGEGDLPAAYLLVIVDLILSHWPSSKDVAIPFIANPDLLILDRERQTTERLEFPDIFGLKEIQREPTGLVSAKSLSERPSRDTSLYDQLKDYTFDEDAARRDRLRTSLQTAMDDLPTPGPDANFGSPEFMVRHALNVLDPANWVPAEYRLEDGRTLPARAYVAPRSEAEHLEPFQAEAQRRMLDTQVQQLAAKVLGAPGAAPLGAVEALLDWGMAQPSVEPQEDDEEEDERDTALWATRETMTNIALIAMRDGDEGLRRKSRDWAQDIFTDRIARQTDRMSGSHDRLQYNALAQSFAGFAFSLRDRAEADDTRRLLELASRDLPSASPGFEASALAIAELDERLVKSVVRCALRARVQLHRNWELEESEYDRQRATLRAKIDAGIQEEIDWITGTGSEPTWPAFPMRDPAPKRRIRVGGQPQRAAREPRARHELFVDSQGAAAWLTALRSVADVSQRPWLRELISQYRDWTTNANGASLEDDEDVERAPTEWNDAYFWLMAMCLPGLRRAEVDVFALKVISGLPANAFLGASARFLRSSDVIYLDFDAIKPAVALHIRENLARTLRSHYAWTRFAGDRSASVEMHMGDAISAFFFHTYHHGFAPAKCYLVAPLVEKTDVFLPVLQGLAAEAPTILVATETLNMLELAPNAAQLPFVLTTGKAWIAARPDDHTFWVDYGIGGKLSRWLGKIRQLELAGLQPGTSERNDVDLILAALVRVGVPEAGRLEAELNLGG